MPHPRSRRRPGARLWLIPLIYMAASVIAAYILPRLEFTYFPEGRRLMSVTSAQAFLSAVSSGMMALTGIVFAYIFLALQFSTTAYSKRFVAIARRNPGVYHALGACFATFIYSLATLAWVDRFGRGFVPFVSTELVVVLLAASLLRLALLMQSIGSLQLVRALAMVGDVGRDAIATTYPSRLSATRVSSGASNDQLPSPVEAMQYTGEPRAITGFDQNALVALARKNDCVIQMQCAVGDTVLIEMPLWRIYGGAARISEAELHRLIDLEPERAFEHDPKYAFRLLVDTAIMALSPAVNDPTTAVQAMDQIEDLLRRVANVDLGSGKIFDQDGKLRLVYPVPQWNDFLSLALDEIRLCGAQSPQVLRRLRSLLTGLLDVVHDDERRASVQDYLSHLNDTVSESSLDASDRSLAMQEDRQGLGSGRHS